MTNKDDLFERHKEREDKALTTIAGLFVLACVLATTVGSLFGKRKKAGEIKIATNFPRAIATTINQAKNLEIV